MRTAAFVLLGIFVIERALFYLTDALNLNFMRKHDRIPEDFRDAIDEETFKRSRAYTSDKAVFSCLDNLFGDILMAVFLFGGLLNWYNSLLLGWGFGFILTGWLYFILLMTVMTFLKIPFDLYDTFRIENRYGFNTMKKGLWIADFIKSLVVQTILFSALVLAALWFVKILPDWWWLALWGFYFLFTLFMMVLSPYVIEPLFNKYTPLEDEELSGKIKNLLDKTGIKVERVFKMDASKRSRHANAYFSGIGRVKRIVLFDTLLEKFSHEEILSVLAHEAGHWKKKHVLKRLAATEIVSFAVFCLVWVLVRSDMLSGVFGIRLPSFYSNSFVAVFSLGLLSFIFNPVVSWFSRKDEKEADRFAVELMGEKESMISALKKLVRENLSNLDPHPLMVFFRYSHPPVRDRIKFIRGLK